MFRPKLFLAALIVALLIPAQAQEYEFLGKYRAHRVDANQLTVQSGNRPLQLEFFEQGTVLVRVGDEVSSDLLEPMPQELKPVPVEVTETEASLLAVFSGGKVEIRKSPLRLTFYRPDDSTALADDPAFGHGWSGNEVRSWKVLHNDEQFFGLGEKSGDVNKRGRFWTNWNADTPAYRNDTDPLYCGIPFFLGRSNSAFYGIFFVNSQRSTFNLGAGNKRLFSFGADGGALSYYVFLGPEPEQIISAYTAITGKMFLPPRWSLGYQQCRWSYYPDYEIRDLAREFRQREIPCDVLYFDIHYMDAYKVFTWSQERFPNPAHLLSDLESDGFKTVTIIDPGVKVEAGYAVYEEGKAADYFLKYLDGELFQGQVWPGWCHFPDFRQAAARSWWGAKDAEFRNMGIDGFWNDMNEPALWGKEMPFVVEGIKALHNRFGLLMAQATFDGLRKDDPAQRPFVVTRAGWAGIQRFAAVWTGDNSATFDDLALSIRTNIGLGLSGVPFVGCDIGGFNGEPDSELYVRWMQAASLSPFMRSHTTHDTRDQEPWAYGEESERRCKAAIERRYRLLPYLYSALYKAHQTGLPVIRPLWLEQPQDQTAYSPEYQHQFMVGDAILAAPVIRRGQRFQKVYLPKGRWYQPDTEKFHEGGQAVIVEAGLDTLPLFYRAGSVVASREVQQYANQKPLTELFLTVVPGQAGQTEVVLDDGLSYQEPGLLGLKYDGKNTLTVKADRLPPSLRTLNIRVAGQAGLNLQRPANTGRISW